MTSVTMRSFHCQKVGGPPRVPPWLEARMRLGRIWKDLPVSRRTRNCQFETAANFIGVFYTSIGLSHLGDARAPASAFSKLWRWEL